ncbi:hypothetical protein B9Z55_028187 [Caenorhabditis nigoni]|uniref:Uncharacterized protein n=1 Tax=Caenorhabditis nigoni TaxID=1611254 RepID=A0A2G5SD17_9PELO|nr:hypothetical protein B9Z55_028187 [Caenorhabditis nigoni]
MQLLYLTQRRTSRSTTRLVVLSRRPQWLHELLWIPPPRSIVSVSKKPRSIVHVHKVAGDNKLPFIELGIGIFLKASASQKLISFTWTLRSLHGGTVSAEMPSAVCCGPDPTSHLRMRINRGSTNTIREPASPLAQMPQFHPPTFDLKGPSSSKLHCNASKVRKETDHQECSNKFQKTAKRRKEAVKHFHPKQTTGQFLEDGIERKKKEVPQRCER